MKIQPQRTQSTQRKDLALANTVKTLCDKVREIAYAIHVYHGHGHLEKVYENALVHRLRTEGLDVKQQHPLRVFDEEGTLIGDYLADLVVGDALIVELKTAKVLAPEHEAQIMGYLKSARMEHGLLINFGSYKFKIRKFILSSWLDCGVMRAVTSLVSVFFALLAVKFSA